MADVIDELAIEISSSSSSITTFSLHEQRKVSNERIIALITFFILSHPNIYIYFTISYGKMYIS